MLTQVEAGQLRPALFLQIAFLSETVYLWSGLGALTPAGPAYDPESSFPYGQAFTGMGWLGQIQSVPQVTDVVASNITLLLSGIPAELITDAIQAVRQNSVATLWLGMLDANGNVVGDPEQCFQGALDVPTITEGAETCALAITCENPLIDLNRAPERRYTDVDQQMDYPGDTGFAAVQLLQDYNIVWPAPYSSSINPSPPNYLTIYVGSPDNKGPFAIARGGTLQLTCIETRNDGSTQNVSGGGGWGGPWFSSDESVATVTDNGLVTAVGQGMCNIMKHYVEGMFLTNASGLVKAACTVIVTG